MAGDWIPIETDIFRKPKVLQIAHLTGRSRHEVVGLLVDLWAWASGHSTDGKLGPVSVPFLSHVIGADDAFWRAVEQVKWLDLSDGISIPNADNWITRGAKARLTNTKRKQDVRNLSRSKQDKNGTTEQNRTVNKEKKKRRQKTTTGDVYSDAFEEFWKACPKREAKGAAWKAWGKAVESEVPSKFRHADEPPGEFLIRRMYDYAASVSRKDLEFVKHPATWLNQRCWDDEMPDRTPTEADLKNWNPTG